MVLLKDIKGQDNAVKFLVNCVESGRIPNAFLFSGPEGVGRALAAKALVAALFCRGTEGHGGPCGSCPVCRRVEALQHPDLLWIKPEKNKLISIDEIRKAKNSLALKPYEAPFSVCVIEDAHMMRQEAANAMLKVLEEPPSGALLILISGKRELLLPTVVSRCFEVRFRCLSVKDTRDIILRRPGAQEGSAEFLASLSQGSPGRAIEMMEEGLLERREELFSTLENVVSSAEAALLSWDDETKDGLMEDIELMLLFMRDAALAKEGLGEKALDKAAAKSGALAVLKEFPLDKIHRITERLVGLKQALAGNANPKIAAQALPGLFK